MYNSEGIKSVYSRQIDSSCHFSAGQAFFFFPYFNSLPTLGVKMTHLSKGGWGGAHSWGYIYVNQSSGEQF